MSNTSKFNVYNDVDNMLNRPTQPFKGAQHRGVDFAKAAHSPYRAIKPGKVTGVWHSPTLGNIVEVSSAFTSIAYAHVLDPVKIGHRVRYTGGPIGKIAGPNDNYATGSITDGNHEHIALQNRRGGYYNGDIGKNPISLINSVRRSVIRQANKYGKRIAKGKL